MRSGLQYKFSVHPSGWSCSSSTSNMSRGGDRSTSWPYDLVPSWLSGNKGWSLVWISFVVSDFSFGLLAWTWGKCSKYVSDLRKVIVSAWLICIHFFWEDFGLVHDSTSWIKSEDFFPLLCVVSRELPNCRRPSMLDSLPVKYTRTEVVLHRDDHRCRRRRRRRHPFNNISQWPFAYSGDGWCLAYYTIISNCLVLDANCLKREESSNMGSAKKINSLGATLANPTRLSHTNTYPPSDVRTTTWRKMVEQFHFIEPRLRLSISFGCLWPFALSWTTRTLESFSRQLLTIVKLREIGQDGRPN